MSFEPESYDVPDSSAAAERTNTPGILLIVVGAVNLLGAIYYIGNGAYSALSPEAAAKASEELARTIGVAGFGKQTPDQVRMVGVGYIMMGLVALVGCFLTILAGIRMRALQSYGLAMTGAVIAALPCISCLGCCGVGQVIGIWAVVVLLNEEIKAAFT